MTAILTRVLIAVYATNGIAVTDLDRRLSGADLHNRLFPAR